ncbi:MAG: AmmeMemoRadiSam system protein B [Rhodocyclales bacterium]|nr:AmmeMemoRadiSam system protein B [Rhodocyclales bacterium]
MNPTIRLPAVAGMFYPGQPQTLADDVQAMLQAAAENFADASSSPQPGAMRAPKALVAPHAGYVYSGPIAASVYALLRPAAATIRRVVLLGPTHRVGVRGLALPSADAFATPLGRVDIDRDAVALLRDLPQVVVADPPHAQEHSLEVQLPFLQSVLPDFRLVPLAVGLVSAEAVAEVIERLWGGPETLIVVSSDLSHYLPYAAAREIDGDTAERVLACDPSIGHDEACGATPLNGLLIAARRHGLQPRLVDLRNSGDTAGDRSRVVGYGAFAFMEPVRGQ